MTEHPHDEHFLQRYLLGEVTEEERERLQESYFVDAGLFSRLLSAEADLIDAYGRGELTPADRERFAQRFGNVRGIDRRLNFASMLSRAADRHSTSTQQAASRSSLVSSPPSSLPWLSSINPSVGSRVVRAAVVAIAAVIVVMAVFVAARRWSPTRNTGREGDLARVQTDSPTAPPNTKPASPVTPDPIRVGEKSTTAGASSPTAAGDNRQPPLPKAQLASVSVILHGGMTREGGEGTTVVLSPAVRSLQTKLELPAELQTRTYSSFQVVLQTVSGQEVIKRSSLKISKGRDSSVVRVSIPAELLTTRDYVVLLNGQLSDGTQQYLRGYFFSVVRK